MGDIDLSSPLAAAFFRFFMGDLAAVLDAGLLEEYRLWLTRFKKEESFPVMLLNPNWLQFKIRWSLS